jgi:hypothetical protein
VEKYEDIYNTDMAERVDVQNEKTKKKYKSKIYKTDSGYFDLNFSGFFFSLGIRIRASNHPMPRREKARFTSVLRLIVKRIVHDGFSFFICINKFILYLWRGHCDGGVRARTVRMGNKMTRFPGDPSEDNFVREHGDEASVRGDVPFVC